MIAVADGAAAKFANSITRIPSKGEVTASLPGSVRSLETLGLFENSCRRYVVE